MKKPVTCGAHRILHDLFKNGAMFKYGLHSEKLRELEGRGYVAISANSLVYLTPTGQQSAIESFVGEGLLASEYYARATAPADNAGPYEAELCGNTIEQETLSKVLANSLHTIDPEYAGKDAKLLAAAVNIAFNELNTTASNAITDQNSAKLVVAGPLVSGDKPDTASGRLSSSRSIKAEGGIQTLECRNFVVGIDPADKPDSTVKVKLELDASEAMKSLDEFRTLISKAVNSAITDALKPGGKLREAINQKTDVSGLQALSSRVFQLERALVSQGSQITELQAKHARTR